MWEMTYRCGKWLKYLRNGEKKLEMIQINVKWLKYVRNSLSI